MSELSFNLDYEAAKVSQSIVSACHAKKDLRESWEKVENVINKTLGIVQEDSVYAATLFLLTRTKEDELVAGIVVPELFAYAERIVGQKVDQRARGPMEDKLLRFLSDKVVRDLERLLLVKQAWEQCLIYCRYAAKALKPSQESGKPKVQPEPAQ